MVTAGSATVGRSLVRVGGKDATVPSPVLRDQVLNNVPTRKCKTMKRDCY